MYNIHVDSLDSALTTRGNEAPLNVRVNINFRIPRTIMPHLRRQPNPRDHIPNQNPNAPGNLRAQFQTPPSRHTPTNPTHQHHPSTGSNAFTPDPVAQAEHPAAPINPFTIFGRPRAQPPQQMMDDDDFDDDFDPRGRSMQELDEDGPVDHDDSFEDDEAIEGQFDDSDIDDEEVEEVTEDQFEEEEDADEEMHDRGTNFIPTLILTCLRFISTI